MMIKAGKLVSEGCDLVAAEELKQKGLLKEVNAVLRKAGYVLVFQCDKTDGHLLGVHVERWNVNDPEYN